MKRIFGILLSVGLFFLCSADAFGHESKKPKQRLRNGSAIASWYGLRFHGKRMASGAYFNMLDPSIVAHKTLPLGTAVRITNPKNKRSIVVRVLDRGPYIKGRSFDLSYAAARELGFVNKGVIRVYFEILQRCQSSD